MTPGAAAAPPARRVLRGISELRTPTERIAGAALVIENGRVAWRGPAAALPPAYADAAVDDLGGRAVLPGLVDSHTHLVWAGSRVDEHRRRARGESYEAILEAGGGIHSTVAATRAASEEELVALARRRAAGFLRGGVTTLEIKSGYGLEPEPELRMLRAIRRLAAEGPQRVVPTFLAHVVPAGRDRARYLDQLTTELIPEVARTGLAEAVDVFCDRGAFTLAEARRVLEAGLSHGLGIKAHAEQLEPTGAARLVAELGGLSADHLERAGTGDWRALAASGTVGTVLPGAAVLLKKPVPDARAMVDAGVTVAVASDHNPGSSPVVGLLPMLQLASALGGLTLEEALAAGTAHAADALARPELGRLEPGSAADLLVVDGPEALWPLVAWGPAPLVEVRIGGEVAWRAEGAP